MKFAETYEVEAKAVKETDNAIKVITDDGHEAWIPKSQIDDDSEVYEAGHEGVLVVSQWIAEEKEWV